METNPSLAHRVIPLRERVEKTIVAIVVYVGVMGGLYWYYGEIPEYLSRDFLIGAAISIVLLAYVFLGAFKNERALDKDRARMIRMRIDDDRSGRHWTSRIGLNVKTSLGRLVMLAGIAMILFGLFVLGQQAYVWFTSNTWVPAPTMYYVQSWVTWLYTSDIWLTGQRAAIATLNWLHVGVPLAFIGAFLAANGARFMERARDKAIADRKADRRPTADF